MITALPRYVLGGCALGAILAGCGGAQPAIGPLGAPQQNRIAATHSKIEHVVIVVQMGRSFNDLFYGYPGAKSTMYGYDSSGRKVELKPVSLATRWNLGVNAYAACNGTGSLPGTDCRMNGFNNETWTCGLPGEPRCPIKYPPYSYVPHDETRLYFDIAQQYVLADEMYASNFSASSFGSLQYVIAAQDHNTFGYPSGAQGCGGGPLDWINTVGGKRIHPCFNYATLGDELDAAQLSWAYYGLAKVDQTCGTQRSPRLGFGAWIAYWATKHIYYGPDCKSDVVSPPKHFLADVKAGALRTVSWVTPRYEDSDMGGSGSVTGPSWVASLVNAVGESKYWNSTAIFILWDSYGGWYDPEPPEYLDEEGLGFRVPLVIVSPYAKRGYVSHVHYEHGSILKFAEDQFGLGRLAASDRRANSPERDAFDFSKPPRKFVPLKRD
ncbi:MAG TPA: alkaline phosphatase family protein [Candidatus Cybelea sp.]|jgi:phospholipase C|nr:alkaline phosphatase family protein [Candidatus Cybelea sp.]